MIKRRCRDCIHAKVSRHPEQGALVSCEKGWWPKQRKTIRLDHINVQIDSPFVPGTATPLAKDCPHYDQGDED